MMMLSLRNSMFVFIVFHLTSVCVLGGHSTVSPLVDPTANYDGYDYNYVRDGDTNDMWEQYWSDWVNVGDDLETGSFVTDPSRISEKEFFATLHQTFRSNDLGCMDKDKDDCKFWASQNFCTHDTPKYRNWMRKNCPSSCGLCKKACADRRENCRALARFCTGNFQEHMIEYCPATCNLCTPNQQNQSGQTGNQRQESNSEQSCFPTSCGVAPVMQVRRRRNSRSIRDGVITRIVGGARAIKGEWPWHGMLVQRVDDLARTCGITIISRHWLVTAAHCVVSRTSRSEITREIMRTFTIYVGRHQSLFGHVERSVQTFRENDFERFIVHPEFQLSPSFSYDIALIKLKWNSPIHFNRLVQPICMAQTNDLRMGDQLYTYGWGETLGHGPSAQVLKDIRLPFMENQICKRKVWGLREEGSLCAGGRRDRDSCTGDSGGSLVKQKAVNNSTDTRFFFYGITSYGTHYCNTQTPYKPAVYTDIAHYYSWIMEQTNRGCPYSTSSSGNSTTSVSGSLESRRASRLAGNGTA